MGRKKNKDEAMGGVPVCLRCRGPLERLMAPSPYECDKCHAEIFTGACFFGCSPCDFSLCGGCYVNQAAEVAEANEKAEKYAKYIVPEGTIHPEIWSICDQYNIEDRLVRQLNEEMKHRHETWESDMEKLRMEMRFAKGPAGGLLWSAIKKMRDGTFFGMQPPHPELARVIKEYKLDQDAKDKLTDFLQKRERNGDDWEKDLWETEQRLMTCRNPSMMALTMVVCLQQGKELPKLKPVKKDPVKQYDERHGRSGRDRERSRSDRRQRERYRSSERDRGVSSRGSRGADDYGGGDDRRDGYRQDDRRSDRGGGQRGDRGGRDDDRGRSYRSGGRGDHGGSGGGGGDGGYDPNNVAYGAISYNYA